MRQIKWVVASVLLSLVAGHAIAQDALPFVGKRHFNFMGGSGTENIITISKDGSTKIVSCGDLAAGGNCSVEYKGPFKNRIELKDGIGYLFKDGKIYSLDRGKIETGCLEDETKPCVSDLN